MTARVGYLVSALVLMTSALVGIQFSSATWTHDSETNAQVTAVADWAPPTVVVSDLDPGISATTRITAVATDDRSDIANVVLEYALASGGGWAPLEVNCSPPTGPSPLSYGCDWVTTSVPDGDYVVRATATDAATPDAHVAVSALEYVQVANSASIVLDYITGPTRGSVNLTATFYQPVSASAKIYVEYLAGSTWTQIGDCYTQTVTVLTCTWDTTAYADGTYELRARAEAGSTRVMDTQSLVVDNTAPVVTINQSPGQADPTNQSPVSFTVVFSEAVTGFEAGDVVIGGTSEGSKSAVVTGAGTTFVVEVLGMSGDGTVTATIPAGVAIDPAGNPNVSATSADNSVQFDGLPTTVTINQAANQPDPTAASSISYVVNFSRPVTGFSGEDVAVTGTAAGAKTVAVTGSGATYSVVVSGMTASGTVVATVAAGATTDGYGGGNLASTSSDNMVTFDVTAPTVRINQAVGQADPTFGLSISFTAVFSEPVTGFTSSDVSIGGTAGGPKAVIITGSGPTYTVQVSGMTTPGTVIAAIPAHAATDLDGNPNAASTSTDNSVTYTLPPCTAGAATVTAIADASVSQATPTANSGTSSTLAVESRSNSRSKRSLVKFTLPTVPLGCSVTGATLSLYNETPTSGRSIDVHRATSDWSESLVTWGTQPTMSASAAGSATPTAPGLQQWSVTDLVLSQYVGPNYGFVLKDRVEGDTGAGRFQSYRSREYGSGPPQLVINWS